MAITIKGGQKPRPNKPCPCGSGLKAKFCHSDRAKKAACEAVVREHMYHLTVAEKIKKGLICQHGISKDEKCIDCNGPQELELGEEEK